MFAVIQNVRPDWVVAENVRGLVTWNEGMVLETVCADLESEGYEVQPIVIPAVAIGAPHRRDRVWFVAKNTINGCGDGRRGCGKRCDEGSAWDKNWLEVATELCGMDDGLSPELDFAGWSKARHRVERLKSLGNAIVPQVAIEILKGINLSSL
jgi:site-specific DNA-cytosine methylase